jgi:nucleoside-triphosphatase
VDLIGEPGAIILLTGPRNSGKTGACLQLAHWARDRGLDCAGLACPARMELGRRAGSDVVDLRTGEQRRFAGQRLRDGRPDGHDFDEEAVAWARARLASACPCDLLIVDEIGPLELELGLGWSNALDILRAGRFEAALVVVRLGLVERFVRTVAEGRTATTTKPTTVVSRPDVAVQRILAILESWHGQLETVGR